MTRLLSTKNKKLFYLSTILLLLTSCTSNRSAFHEHIFISHEFLKTIPDSVLNDNTITKIILAPSWIIEGPIGTPDMPNKNYITELPAKICNLYRLKLLDLTANNIKTLPGCFSDLQNLEELNMSYNSFFDIKSALTIILKLKSLKKINLYGINSVIVNENDIRQKLVEKKIEVIITKADLLKYVENK